MPRVEQVNGQARVQRVAGPPSSGPVGARASRPLSPSSSAQPRPPGGGTCAAHPWAPPTIASCGCRGLGSSGQYPSGSFVPAWLQLCPGWCWSAGLCRGCRPEGVTGPLLARKDRPGCERWAHPEDEDGPLCSHSLASSTAHGSGAGGSGETGRGGDTAPERQEVVTAKRHVQSLSASWLKG